MRYSIARRAASNAASKQSPGVAGASTGSGDSPWRPCSACSRSDCSVFVGMPVEGPARCTSTTTSGSSSIAARPIVSAFRSIPGPLVAVTPRWPPKAAPSAIPAAAISSSAWIVRDARAVVARELVQQLRGGRDRIAREQQRQAALHGGGDQPERGRRRAVDLAVGAGRDVGRGRDAVLHVEQLGRLAEAPAGAEGREVGRARRRPRRELRLDPALGDVGGTAVEPRQQAEREEVLRSAGVARADAFEALGRARGERRHRHAVDAEVAERRVLQRVAVVAGLLEVASREGVLVGDDRRAALERREVRLQRRRVHRDEHVRRVAGREDVARGEVDLEGRDAGDRAGGGADLRREVGQRREVVAEQRRGVREAPADQLHAVPRVPREAHDHALALLDRLAHVLPFPLVVPAVDPTRTEGPLAEAFERATAGRGPRYVVLARWRRR